MRRKQLFALENVVTRSGTFVLAFYRNSKRNATPGNRRWLFPARVKTRKRLVVGHIMVDDRWVGKQLVGDQRFFLFARRTIRQLRGVSMAIRTRVACVAMLLFIGWVFASPFQPTPEHAEGTASSDYQSPLTLQIRAPSGTAQPAKRQGNWPEDYDDRSYDPRPDADPQDPLGTTKRSLETLDQRLPDRFARPSRFSVATPALEDQFRSAESPRPLQPVRMLGDGIGQPIPNDRPSIRAPQPASQTIGWPAVDSQPLPPVAQGRLSSSPSRLRTMSGQRRWHRIVNGDSLESLAKKYLGHPRWALLIFDKNRNVLATPEILPIGTELQIPAAPPADATLQPRAFEQPSRHRTFD